MHKGFRYSMLLAAGVAIPVLTNGCSAVSDATGAVCCKEYQPGTDMLTTDFKVDASIKGQFTAFAQASGDIATVGGNAVADVTGSCTAIATDLGADPQDPGAAGLAGTALMNFWCNKAVAQINANFTATGVAKAQLTLQYDPPQCSMSLSAQADCQAKCDVSGMCDIKANPPTCTGGTLEVDCKGGCTASGTAPSFDCTGSCSGNCTGSCEAQGGVAVDCTGHCDGTCAAGTAGNGVQTDGSCKGTCSGHCTIDATAPKVTCKGTCSGQCDAKCTAAPGQASVKCGGKCDVQATPLECKGGTLSGGCMVDAKCSGSCNASVQAKATCTEPKLVIAFSGSVKAGAEGQYNALLNTLETNLPKLLVVVEGRGKAFGDAFGAVITGGADLTASGKLDAHGAFCIAAMTPSIQSGVDNFTGALSASVSVIGTVK